MRTYATLFTGGDLFGVGASAAGLSPSWGVECDARIADFAELNTGARVVRDLVESVDFSLLPVPFWLHCSPSCKNASVAKTDGKESPEDIAAAEGIARAIDILRPPQASLENVWKYRTFQSFRIVCAALGRNGYSFKFWRLNSADYGVAQTRQRLILLASRFHKPHRPPATHREGGDMFCAPWVGWYESIEDLIPTLPESKFAAWQLKRLRGFFTQLIGGGNTGDGENNSTSKQPSEPTYTVAADSALRNTRAFIVSDQASEGGGIGLTQSDAPMLTVDTRRATKLHAFIVDGKPANYEGELQVWGGENPDGILTASQPRHPFRAFIAHPSADNDRFVVRTDNEPTFTQTNTAGALGGTRAWLGQGRVVAMTTRALARFQSVPDSYILPAHNGLACEIIGNGLPCVLAQRFIESELSI